MDKNENTTTPTGASQRIPLTVKTRENTKAPAPVKRADARVCACCQSVPDETSVRLEIQEKIAVAVEREQLIAPMGWDELMERRDRLMEEHAIPGRYQDFVAVLLSNAVWTPVLRRIPYERRVLLLPQCLRREESCQAIIDDFGLMCLECGACSIGKLQPFAESLGYAVVVAEGTTIVTQMIESGQVEAVVGVSCLSVLERAFPHMAAHAIPGVAIPLQRAGCSRTDVDVDWLMSVLKEYAPEEQYTRLDLGALEEEVAQWFTRQELGNFLNVNDTATEACALDWMAQGGKRWRPLLTVAAYRALTGSSQTPHALRRAAIAVECFHKASLVHDDLVDAQDERYGKPTLHSSVGGEVALNVGDLLIGEGYRLLAESEQPPEVVASLVRIAARGHRALSLGQGEELWARSHGSQLSMEKILEIFEHKTSPAFHVALAIGAVWAHGDEATLSALAQFSKALGIAYQIQDDLEDIEEDCADDCGCHQPTGNACCGDNQGCGCQSGEGSGCCGGEGQACKCRPGQTCCGGSGENCCSSGENAASAWTPSIVRVLRDRLIAEGHKNPDTAAREEAEAMIDRYRAEAMHSIRGLRNGELKALLHRLCARILKKSTQ